MDVETIYHDRWFVEPEGSSHVEAKVARNGEWVNVGFSVGDCNSTVSMFTEVRPTDERADDTRKALRKFRRTVNSFVAAALAELE